MASFSARLYRIPDEAARLLRAPGTWAVLLGAVVFLPFLGASGLWDPWETHYGEVARRMVVDGDWITPRWRNELFFSKPILIFWMMGASFKLFGISALAARLPFALVGILGVYLAYRPVARLTDPRRGLWASLVMATSPFYFFIARQAITDIVFCVCMLGVLGNFILVALEERPRRRDVLAIYLFAALAALAKTPVGLAIPVVVALVYLVLSGDWAVLRKLKLHIGIPVFLVVAVPWYLAMVIKYGQRYYGEFFIDHNVSRAFTGVHGERGTFEYYLKQLGYGFFPWVGLLPLACGRLAARLRGAGASAHVRLGTAGTAPPGPRLDLFLAVWLGVTFMVFTLIVTKFHHYIFPALPPLAILAGLALAERDEGLWRFMAPLGALILVVVANDVISSPAHLSNLCTYAYDRPLPEDVYPRWFLFGCAAAWTVLLIVSRFVRAHRLPALLLAAVAGASALVLSWFYIPALGHTLSQRDLFETYERYAQPGDKLYQYQMNWRGEVFYSADTIIKLSSESAVRNVLKQDRRMFIIAITDGFSAVDRAARMATGKHLHVLPGSNSRYTLASNRLDPGVEDLNPLAKAVLSEAPPIGHPVRAVFREGITFLGYDLEPEHPAPGDAFELTLYFEAREPVAKNWRVFIHIDRHGRTLQRIHGDHYPVQGLFPTNRWMQGDIVRDRVQLEVPASYSRGAYTLYLGLYIGDRRMHVMPGSPQDGANRVRAGIIEVR